jgi:hypothetical protein
VNIRGRIINSPSMRRLLVPAAFLPLLLVPAAEPAALTATVVEFSYNGTDGTDGSPQTFVVPPGVTRITINAWGAGGSRNGYRSVGGAGAHAKAALKVTPGEVLTIRVGGRPPFNNVAAAGGYNGGGAPGVQGYPLTIIPGGGGGASDVRRGGDSLDHRIVVAGGGGGAGAPASHRGQTYAKRYTGGVGGDSGALGGDGGLIGTLYDPSRGGEPGLADAGGLGGQPGYSAGQCGFEGPPGDFGVGGPSIGGINYPGAGGGGWYGGGAGASGGCEWGPNDDYVGGAGGGGGGSSLVPAGGTVTEAVRAAHGSVVIRY